MRATFLALALALACSPACDPAPPPAAPSLRAPPAEADVLGLTEAELVERWPEFARPDTSFDLLVSKTIDRMPHRPPDYHVLRYGDTWLVVEIAGGVVVGLHHAHG